MVWKSVFDEIKGERTWRRQRKVYFFVKIAGTKRANGWVQCPACKEWNTFVEEKITVSVSGKSGAARSGKETDINIVPLMNVSTDEDERIQTQIQELDRVLGGGIVEGSLVLVGGDPGIGKIYAFAAGVSEIIFYK